MNEPLETSSLPQANTEIDSSQVSSGFVYDMPFPKELQKEQVFNYLTNSLHDNSRQKSVGNAYEKLGRETFDLGDEKGEKLIYRIQPKPERNISYSIPLQRWEGTVIEVTEDSFLAKLVDRNHINKDEEADILISEVSEDDLELVKPGAVFYWNISYQTGWTGQRRRSSIIKFRRLPVWTNQDIQKSQEEADRISKLLNWR